MLTLPPPSFIPKPSAAFSLRTRASPPPSSICSIAASRAPDSLKPEAYERTLRARAFDVARYLLPLATNTSLGQIISARTLETQVSRLLSHPFAEVRLLGEKLREAATSPAWNLNAPAAQAFIDKLSALTDDAAPALAAEAAALFTRDIRTAPTLVKYAQPNPYIAQTQAELAQAAAEILAALSSNTPPHAVVDLVERTESLEVELAATLLYSASHHPYRQIRDLAASLPAARISEIIDLGTRHRGRHDELLRAFHAGAALRFDILMDIGGFRDMHRHRRCTQIIQGFTWQHGYETPGSGDLPAEVDILAEAGVLAEYCGAVESAHAAATRIAAGSAPEAAQSALYLFPLATRIRALFKMDFAEAQYISELRSAPAGHFSYRRVAWEMFLKLAATASHSRPPHPRHGFHPTHRHLPALKSLVWCITGPGVFLKARFSGRDTVAPVARLGKAGKSQTSCVNPLVP